MFPSDAVASAPAPAPAPALLIKLGNMNLRLRPTDRWMKYLEHKMKVDVLAGTRTFRIDLSHNLIEDCAVQEMVNAFDRAAGIAEIAFAFDDGDCKDDGDDDRPALLNVELDLSSNFMTSESLRVLADCKHVKKAFVGSNFIAPSDIDKLSILQDKLQFWGTRDWH